MADEPTHTSVSSPHSPPRELAEYRSPSVLAIVALLISLISPVAFAHPGAWSLPMLTVLVGLVALVRIHRQPDVLAGGRIAQLAVIIGLFVLACAPARYYGDRWILFRESREFVELWLSSVRDGELDRAHQATLDFRRRQPEGTLLDEYYAMDADLTASREAFFARPVPDQLRELGADLEFEFEENLALYHDQGSVFMTQRFRVFRRGEQVPAMRIQTETERVANESGVYWMLVGLIDADEFDQMRAPR